MADTNGFEGTPWSVDGAEHPGALLRRAAWAFTSGAEGVISPGDLKVSELGIPGEQVQVGVGGVLIANRSPGGVRQSYFAVANDVSLLDVSPNLGTTTRYDLICVRVEDPEYGPFDGPPTPEDALNWQYAVPFILENVPANTRLFSQRNLDYSAYAVALLALPGETGTVIDSYLTDLRKIARPQRDSFFDVMSPTAQQALTAAGPGFTPWATQADKLVTVPEWATKAVLRTTMGGVMSYVGTMWGDVRMRLAAANQTGTVVTRSTSYDINTPSSNAVDRHTLILGGKVDVPAALRGQTVYLGVEGRRTGGSTGIEVNPETSIFTEVEWIEAAA